MLKGLHPFTTLARTKQPQDALIFWACLAHLRHHLGGIPKDEFHKSLKDSIRFALIRHGNLSSRRRPGAPVDQESGEPGNEQNDATDDDFDNLIDAAAEGIGGRQSLDL